MDSKPVIAYKALLNNKDDIEIWETTMDSVWLSSNEEDSHEWRTTRLKALSALFDKYAKILMKIPDKMIEVANEK